jgi:CubicO group peptidase (beta-lactamase class C family)
MRLAFCFLLLTCCSSCWMLRAYKVRKFELTDHERMPFVTVQKSNAPSSFIDATTAIEYGALKTFVDANLSASLTAAFLIIRNDSVIYEGYFNGFKRESLLPSFSIAKSFVSTLVSIALAEGRIGSLQQPVTDYLPELKKRDHRFTNITLQHLLDMRSGLQFKEGSYGIKDAAIKLGFRPNLLKHSLKVKIKTEPGKAFEYQSINTQLLAIVVERATGKKISAYLQEKLWQPLGAEHNATWNVDSKKHQQEIAFAGLNATARDFAKLGQLYLHKGVWNGQQLLQPSWVRTVNNADSMNKARGYKNQFWSNLAYMYFADSLAAVEYAKDQKLSTAVKKASGKYRVGKRTAAFHAEGILNQYIYINPDKNLVIVRLGRHWYHPNKYPAQFIYELGEEL